MLTVSKLEFVPVPSELTVLCLVSQPPLDADGELRYEALPEYLVEVLGILEGCNSQLLRIENLKTP